MLSSESRRGRRIVARLDRGTDLFEGIRALCQKHRVRCGELRGIGSLEQAELSAFDQAQRRWKPARTVAGGGLELLHLAGNLSEEDGAISIQCQATLMRDRDAGVEVLGGHLRRAVVYSVELVIESFDDLVLRRQADAATGLSRWQEALSEAHGHQPARGLDQHSPPLDPVSRSGGLPTVNSDRAEPLRGDRSGGEQETAGVALPPAPAPTIAVAAPPPIASPILAPAPIAPPPIAPVAAAPANATPTPTWAAVAAVSEAQGVDDEDIVLNAGDVILHPRFQRCVVHRVEGGGEFVQVMLKNGRVVRLSLEVLRLTPKGIENGQRIFAATVL
jgi:predicted DNA-binding protein with PD1-like motif